MSDSKDFDFMPIGKIDKSYKFIIPAYQRGYRWDKEETETLLNDLYAYYNDKYLRKGNKEIYCLQPLCVIEDKTDDDKEHRYIVLDGQQRLTTFSILLRYLYNKTDKNKSIFAIEYETRKKKP